MFPKFSSIVFFNALTNKGFTLLFNKIKLKLN